MSDVILRRWSGYFLQTYGSVLPEDYLCFDTETTGLNRDRDLPVEIGHTLVRGRRVVDQGSYVLDWTRDPRIDQSWLQSRTHEVKRTMEAGGKHYRFTMQVLREEGRHPDKVLSFYRRLFEANREVGAFFVGQNAWFFDAFLLEGCFRDFLRQHFEFGANELFDTGTMEKACLLGILPTKGESLRTYFLRVRDAWSKGVKWSLTQCLIRHGLDKKHKLDLTQAHNAGFDSHACHLLFEDHR